MRATLIPLCFLFAAAGDDLAPQQALREKADRAAAQGQYESADRFLRKLLALDPEGELLDIARERLAPDALLRVVDLESNGPPDNRVDVYVMAEGFQRDRQSQKTFDTHAEGTVRLFFQVPVFERYRKFFNFHAMNIASVDEGVDRGDKQYETALGAYATEFSQGQVAVQRGRVMDFLSRTPDHDYLAIVIVKRGTLGTGGSGVAVASGGPGSTIVHEWGHAFGMLLDEYTADVGYQGDAPRGFNISDSEDPDEVPWAHWLAAKERGVGIIPGGAGRATGVWRPTGGPCAMASGSQFCKVCREAIVASIYGFVSPIDAIEPDAAHVLVKPGEAQLFQVFPLEVASKPDLVVEFYLEPVAAPDPERAEDPLFRPVGPGLGAARPRSSRSVLEGRPRWNQPPPPAPVGTELRSRRRRGAWEVEISAGDLAPGHYELTALVRDPTDWVLKEEWRPLLSDVAHWTVEVLPE